MQPGAAIVVPLLGITFFSAPLHAQVPGADAGLRRTAPSVKPALWRGQSAFETSRSLGSVSGEDLADRQIQTVPEALAETVGVTVQETNRGSGAPIVRGLIGPQVLLLVDGLRFNTSTFRTGPNQYLATIAPVATAQIDVVRGPSSVRYGNGAMGGVVNVRTKSARFNPGFHALAALSGQSADRGASGRVEGREEFGSLALRAGASVRGTGQLRGGDGESQPLSELLSGNVFGRGTLTLPHDLTLSATYLGTFIRDAGRTDQLGRGDLRLYDNDDHFAYLSLGFRGEGPLRRADAALVFHRTDEQVDRFSCTMAESGSVENLSGCAARDIGSVTRRRDYRDTVDVIGVDGEASVSFLDDRIELRGGGEGYFEFIQSSLTDARQETDFTPRAERGNFSDGSRYTTLGAYLHADATVLDLSENGQLQASGGVRLSHFRATAKDVPDVGAVKYRFTGVVASAGLSYLLGPRLNIYGSFVQGFRAPNLQETTVLGDTGSKFEIPNPDLSPERSDTFEVGVKARLGPVRFQVAGFRSNLKNVIDEEPATFSGDSEVDGKPVIQRVNAGSGKYLGIESNAGASAGPVSLAASIAWIRGDVDRATGARVPARRVPPLSGTAHLRYGFGRRAFAEAGIRWAARQDRLHPSDEQDLRICETETLSGQLRSNCRGTPGWVTPTLRGGYHLGRHWSFLLALQNFTDTAYRVHGSGFTAPGIDARATVVARW